MILAINSIFKHIKIRTFKSWTLFFFFCVVIIPIWLDYDDSRISSNHFDHLHNFWIFRYESDVEPLSDVDQLSTFDDDESAPSTEDDEPDDGGKLDKDDEAVVLYGVAPSTSKSSRSMRARKPKENPDDATDDSGDSLGLEL